MRYRFQIVCSEYHKGRLRLVYDPNSVASLEGNIAQSRIIDLTTEKDFVMDVSWGQSLPFANVSLADAFGTTLISGGTTAYANGVLGVYVENDLTTPNSSINNNIQINVFVSACDDFEVAVPVDDIISLLTYSTQGQLSTQGMDEPDLEDDNIPVKNDADEEVMSCLKVDNTYDVHFGESIASFRQLLKRYNYHSSVLIAPIAAGKYNWLIEDRDFPRYRGKWTDAIDAPVTGTTNINNAKTTMINYLAPAYVAYRGGIRWKYLLHNDSNAGTDFQWVFRTSDNSGAYQNIYSAIVFTSTAAFAQNRNQSLAALQAGGEITYTRSQPTLEVEVPYYLPYRFSSTKYIGVTGTDPTNSSLSHIVHTDVTTVANAYYDRLVAGAEDFSLFLFNGMPPCRSIDLTV